MQTIEITRHYVLALADPQATLQIAGGKGASLARLAQAGLPVPDGFHIATQAYDRFVEQNNLRPLIRAALQPVDLARPSTLETASRSIGALFASAPVPEEIASEITAAYAALGGEPFVAVRSSATAEDLPDLSFAGQQETYLNIHGEAAFISAVILCWASLWTARAIGYRLQHAIDQEQVSLAVVVQELVEAEASGVLFTANPLNGRRDQAMLTATWGLGEALVGGLVTPDTLVLDKATGRVLSREIADKTVMTVRVECGTEEHPVPDDLRRKPVLDEAYAAQLACLGEAIEDLYGCPMDIEWALDPTGLHILQARPITALPEPPAPAAGNVWVLPDPKGVYLRSSLVDLMPAPLSPLFVSLMIPAIAGSGLHAGMAEWTHSTVHLPDNYITTINSYAYSCASLTPAELWWVFTRQMPATPRILREGTRFWKEQAQPRYVRKIQEFESGSQPGAAAGELVKQIYRIVEAIGEYIGGLLITTTGASAGSEGLFTQVYEKMIRREGDPPATAFLMGYDSLPIQAEKALFDLAVWAREQPEIKAYLVQTPTVAIREALQEDVAPEGLSPELWVDWRGRFKAHLQHFGYHLYDLDFARPLPLDDPAPMIEVCKMVLRGAGNDPHARQARLVERRTQAVETTLARLHGPKRWLFRKSLGWAQQLAEVRESAIAEIGRGYPLLRRLLSELGRRLSAAGVIPQPDDVYMLQVTELADCAVRLDAGESLPDLTDVLQARRKTLETAQALTPPPVLPPRERFWGIKLSIFTPEAESSQSGQALKGVGASGGQVTAPARVLRGPQDFDEMRPGEVLVAAITTPAWTPLFAMASAVVTDIGGPLSHGSIVAREYGIPAVMGVGVATKRILSGQMITVDGSAGRVFLDGAKSGN